MRAWHSDPKFSDRGQARVLKLYGRGVTFESLAMLYGRGLPVRAILDELILREAVEMASDQGVTPKKLLSIRDRPMCKELEVISEQLRHLVHADSIDQRLRKTRKKSRRVRRNFKRL